ncbi:MAG: tRNA (adenosine(37)-N6)-dimethylallyltransferase MiaA [Pseudomonadota bacterium]
MQSSDPTEIAALRALGLPDIPDGQPVLIAGPTASGKSALALALAERFGGVIVNADASQVYDCWRAISARPSDADEARAPHLLYGHLPYDAPYSAGHWLRDVAPILAGAQRPIIVGGTGLYFAALTEGLADIPATPAAVRAEADALTIDAMRTSLDPVTAARIDLANRARVQRAWEVKRATGRALAEWQDDVASPLLPPQSATRIVLQADKNWLTPRIERRFAAMLDDGALDEARAMVDRFDPALQSCKAIGAPELIAHLRGTISLADAETAATIATRQYAKRQRTWMRARMQDWHHIDAQALHSHFTK